VKNLFTLIVIFLLAACSSARTATSAASSSSSDYSLSTQTTDPVFAGQSTAETADSEPKHPARNHSNHSRKLTSSSSFIELCSPLQFKYAILTGAGVEQIKNLRLYQFIDDWYGVPYQYGGFTREGTDCSGFASSLLSSVYDINRLPRTSREQYQSCKRIKRDALREGDLVFFHTEGKHRQVSHVGIYLVNHKFVHASISGVMISDMGDGYYAERFVGGGRPKS
jgi:lipoprotein Spr